MGTGCDPPSTSLTYRSRLAHLGGPIGRNHHQVKNQSGREKKPRVSCAGAFGEVIFAGFSLVFLCLSSANKSKGASDKKDVRMALSIGVILGELHHGSVCGLLSCK